MAESTNIVSATGKRKQRVGEVVSNKMTKTIVVRVERRFPHAQYKKIVTSYKKFYAHDEKAEAKIGDTVRIDLKKRTANILISEGELAERRAQLQKHPFKFPASQTPWQQIQREMVAQFDEGMVLKPAVKFQPLAQTAGTPRDNH